MTNGRQTESELLFERYLGANGYDDFEFEPPCPGKSKHPDYLLRWQRRDLWFEVKECVGLEQALPRGHFDPYPPLRKKIKKARKQFAEYKDCCCNVVVANLGDPHARLHPDIIFGAMLGNLGFTFSILDADDVQVCEAAQSVFLPTGGEMVRPGGREYENTTIAAVIALEEVRLRNDEFARFQDERIRIERARQGRELTPEEGAVVRWRVGTEFVEAGRGPIYFRAPRVVVCENPGARMPLPRNILGGEFDERWAIVDGFLQPVYAGVRVGEIESAVISEDICLASA